jgi:parvulin-like peptidyl-prolyl isomerase
MSAMRFLLPLMAFLVLACQSPKKEEAPAGATPAAEAPKEGAAATATPPAVPTGAGPATIEPKVYTGVIAKVNGEPLNAELFNEEIAKVVKPGSKIPEERLARIEANILTRMIDDALVAQAVKTETIVVDDAEFQSEYAKYKERFKTDEQYQNFLKYGRMTEEQVQARVREKASLKKLLVKKFGLGVTDEEIKAFYEKNNRFYKEREQAVIKQIVVRLPKNADEAATKAADDKVKKAQEALRTKPFEEVAKELSEDLSAKKGGEMEPITRGRYLKAVEDVAFTLKPNEISKPIKTQVGFHIVKLVEKREERMKTFDEVKGQISETLSNRNFYSAKRKLTDELKKTATIEKLVDIKEPPAATREPLVPTGAPTPGAAEGAPAAEAPAAPAPAEAPAAPAPAPAPAAPAAPAPAATN